MNIGDYVRTKNGEIGKITDMKIEDDFLLRKRYGDRIYLDNEILCFTNEIIKSDPNIIDLIEVGDYVNGDIVIVIWEDKEEQILGEAEPRHIMTRSGEKIYNDDIKSIVTKEQFESMEYKIGGEK